jgi:hypothetical protein
LWIRPRVFPRREHLKGATHAVGSGLTGKHKPRLERLARDKDSSFLLTIINNGSTTLYNIGPGSKNKKSQLHTWLKNNGKTLASSS